MIRSVTFKMMAECINCKEADFEDYETCGMDEEPKLTCKLTQKVTDEESYCEKWEFHREMLNDIVEIVEEENDNADKWKNSLIRDEYIGHKIKERSNIRDHPISELRACAEKGRKIAAELSVLYEKYYESNQ